MVLKWFWIRPIARQISHVDCFGPYSANRTVWSIWGTSVIQCANSKANFPLLWLFGNQSTRYIIWYWATARVVKWFWALALRKRPYNYFSLLRRHAFDWLFGRRSQMISTIHRGSYVAGVGQYRQSTDRISTVTLALYEHWTIELWITAWMPHRTHKAID